MGFWKVVGPSGDTNLIGNPSIETGSTGHASIDANTVSKIATQSRFGDYSLLCTYQSDTTLDSYAITLTAVQHYYSAWVYLASNWDGGAVSLGIDGFTSATINTASTSTTELAKWVKLEMYFTPDAGDLSGNLTIVTASAPTAGRTVWADGFVCIAGSYPITYLDGDQPDCEWNGAAHASTSTRNALSRKGGRIYDLATDFGLYVETMDGVGMPPVTNVSYSRVFRDGEYFQRQRVRKRPFRLRSLFNASSIPDLHGKRQDFIEVIKPTPNGQPILFRYTGAAFDKEIAAQYDTGLEFSGPNGFSERIGLQFLAHDPFFYDTGEESTAIQTGDGTDFTIIAGRVNGRWDDLGPPSTAGTYSNTRAIAVGTDRTLYIGGDFTDFDGNATADYVAAWDLESETWSSIGAMSGIVHTLKIGPDSNLYAGGAFTTAGGTLVNNVAVYDGFSWAALGPPSSGGTVQALTHGRDNKLYIGGSFTNFDGTANADRLASWDGSAWAALSTGANDTVLAMATHPNGDIYIGGDFTAVGGPVGATRIAKWDGSAFTALGSGCNSTVQAIVINEEGDVYVGGQFTTADGVTVNGIARWNGTTFEALGDGVGSSTQVDYMGFWRGDLVIVGPFTTVGGIDYAQRIAAWNGSRWYQLDIKFPSAVSQGPVIADGDDLYTGLFTTGSASYANQVTVTPAGNEKTYPVIKITRDSETGTAKLLSIRNETTGKQLLFDYDLLAGETLTIDLRQDNQKIVSSFWGDQWRIIPGSDVAEFYLLPQDNIITCFVYHTGSAGSSGFIRWKDAYWSAD